MSHYFPLCSLIFHCENLNWPRMNIFPRKQPGLGGRVQICWGAERCWHTETAPGSPWYVTAPGSPNECESQQQTAQMKHLLTVEKTKRAEGWLMCPVRCRQDEADLMWKTTPSRRWQAGKSHCRGRSGARKQKEKEGTSQRGERKKFRTPGRQSSRNGQMALGWEGRGRDEKQFLRTVGYMAHRGIRRNKMKARNAE